jgi:hypothetical protein
VSWHKSILQKSLIIVSIIVFIVGIGSIHKVKPLLSTNDFPDETCLSKALNYRPANGVGNYWIVRGLDVYNKYNEHVLQVNTSLSPFPWLNSLGEYENKNYSFILASRYEAIPTALPIYVYPNLGKSSKVTECPNFNVYQYYPGTDGYKLLNSDLNDFVSQEIKIRNSTDLQLFNLSSGFLSKNK